MSGTPPAPDLFSRHLDGMREMNAGRKVIRIGSRRRPVFHLVISTVRGERVLKNKQTGTTARESDRRARARLLVECYGGLLLHDAMIGGLVGPELQGAAHG